MHLMYLQRVKKIKPDSSDFELRICWVLRSCVQTPQFEIRNSSPFLRIEHDHLLAIEDGVQNVARQTAG